MEPTQVYLVDTVPALKDFLAKFCREDLFKAIDDMPWLFIDTVVCEDTDVDDEMTDCCESGTIIALRIYTTPSKTLHSIDMAALNTATISSVESAAGLTLKSVLQSPSVGKVFLKGPHEACSTLESRLGIKVSGVSPIGDPVAQRSDGPMPPINDLLVYFRHVLGEAVNGDPITDSTTAFLRHGLGVVENATLHAELDRLSAALSEMSRS